MHIPGCAKPGAQQGKQDPACKYRREYAACGRNRTHSQQAAVRYSELPLHPQHAGKQQRGHEHPYCKSQLYQTAIHRGQIKVIAGHQRIKGGQRRIEKHAEGLRCHQAEQFPVSAEHLNSFPELRHHAPAFFQRLFQGRNPYRRQRSAGKGRSDYVAYQNHRHRERRIKRSADNRAQQKGACVQKLHPSVGFDKLLPWHKLRNDGLDCRLLKGTSEPTDTEHDKYSPDRQFKSSQADRIDKRGHSHDHIRENADKFPVKPVSGNSCQRAEQRHGQIRRDSRKSQHQRRRGLLRQPPDQSELDAVAAQHGNRLAQRNHHEFCFPFVFFKHFSFLFSSVFRICMKRTIKNR